MKRWICCTLAVGLLFGAGITTAQEAQQEQAVIGVAEQWLALVDAGNYAQSWRESAASFRNAVSEDSWEQSLKAVRDPLGQLLSREVLNARFTTSLPGAPDGEYVVIQFRTSFENKKSAVETVTPMREKDGRWRVSGYYIR